MNITLKNKVDSILDERINLALFFDDGTSFLSDGKGIFDLLNIAKKPSSLKGAYAADRIVGRAAAFLYVRCKPEFLHVKTLSEGGAEILKKGNIPFEYETLTRNIMNRQGTGICPMDDAVKDIADNDTDKAYEAIYIRAKELRRRNI